MQGYTIRVAEAISNADGKLLGVKLGKLCLEHDISASQIAKRLGVTRQTVYAWFVGKSKPQPQHEAAVERIISALTNVVS